MNGPFLSFVATDYPTHLLPFSFFECRQPPPLPGTTDQSNDEGINETNTTLDVTLPIFENHLTCDEDEEEEDEEEDPVERPPEPTVPDERVDSSSSNSGDSSRRESVSPAQELKTRKKSQQEVMVDAFTKAFTEDALPKKANDNNNQAITSMLSDKPYQKYEDGGEDLHQQPSFAMRLQDEATSR